MQYEVYLRKVVSEEGFVLKQIYILVLNGNYVTFFKDSELCRALLVAANLYFALSHCKINPKNIKVYEG